MINYFFSIDDPRCVTSFLGGSPSCLLGHKGHHFPFHWPFQRKYPSSRSFSSPTSSSPLRIPSMSTAPTTIWGVGSFFTYQLDLRFQVQNGGEDGGSLLQVFSHIIRTICKSSSGSLELAESAECTPSQWAETPAIPPPSQAQMPGPSHSEFTQFNYGRLWPEEERRAHARAHAPVCLRRGGGSCRDVAKVMGASRRAHKAAQKCYSRCKNQCGAGQSFGTAGAGVRECLPQRLITASAPRLEEPDWFSFGRALLGGADKWRVLIWVYKETQAQRAVTLKATSSGVMEKQRWKSRWGPRVVGERRNHVWGARWEGAAAACTTS